MSSGFKKTFELVFEYDIYVVVNKTKSFMSLSIINILKYSKPLKKHITLQIILTCLSVHWKIVFFLHYFIR